MSVAYKWFEQTERKGSRAHCEKVLDELEDKVKRLDNDLEGKADKAFEMQLLKQRKELNELQVDIASVHQQLQEIQRNQLRAEKSKSEWKTTKQPLFAKFTQWMKLWT